MKGLLVVVWKEMLHLRGDKTGLRLMFLVPVVQLFVLGYALTTEVKNTPVAVVDYCACEQSRSLAHTVLSHPLFRSQGFVESEKQMRRLMDRGEVRVGLVIPPDFSMRLEASWRAINSGKSRPDRGAPVRVIIDGQDGNSSQVAGGYLQAILRQWSGQRLEEQIAGTGRNVRQMVPVEVDEAFLFNPLLKSSWYMVPGIAVLLVTMVTALLTGLSIVREKEAGTLEQLMVTPIRPWQVVLGKTGPYMLIGFFELSAILLLAGLWFGIPMRGSVFLLFFFAFIYMFSSLGIGILVSTLARTQVQALFMIWFFLLFFILLSGFFVPIQNLPGWVQNLTLVNPVRYFMAALRDILLKGSDFSSLYGHATSMLLLGAGLFGAAFLTFKRKVE